MHKLRIIRFCDPNLSVHCAAVALIFLSGAILAYQFLVNPNIPFILRDSRASWITAPVNIEVAIDKPEKHVFLKGFETNRNENVFLHLKSFQTFVVRVNGKMLTQTPNLNWKKTTTLNLSPGLTKGVNQLEIEVESKQGPSLLYAYSTGLENNISTDSSWNIIDGTALIGKAVTANDIENPYRKAAIKMQPGRELHMKKVAPVAILFLASGFTFLFVRILLAKQRFSMPLLLGVLNLIWVLLFLRFIRLPTGVGFDAEGHLSYIAYLLKNYRLPLANEGWETFQPPLFYILSAGIVEMFGRVGLSQNALLRIMPAISCFGNIWVTYYVAGKLFRNCTPKIVFITVLAGCLPANVYIAAYISNEGMSSFLATLSVGITTLALFQKRSGWLHMICLGVVSGLALLTKYTALAIFPVIVLFLAVKFYILERLSFLKVIGRLFICSIIAFGISGWHYLNNIKHFGRPLVLNLDFCAQWLFPGFHTAQYYFQFGEVFRNPFFAGYYSFWDGLYSTLWGDGLMGATPSSHFWDYEDMAIGYWLSVPASIVLLFGIILMLQKLSTERSPYRKICYSFFGSLLFTFVCSMVYYSLKNPSLTAVKAFFGLHLMIPLCVSFGIGMYTVDRFLNKAKLLPLRFIFYGWFGTFLWFIMIPYL